MGEPIAMAIPSQGRKHAFGKMTPIAAKVLNVDREGGKYLVTVYVGLVRFSGPFDQLVFENKPDFGWCRCGSLELVYYRDPILKAGQSFPLWAT